MAKKLEGRGGGDNYIHRPGEDLYYNPKRIDDGNIEVDGGPRIRGQDGGLNEGGHEVQGAV